MHPTYTTEERLPKNTPMQEAYYNFNNPLTGKPYHIVFSDIFPMKLVKGHKVIFTDYNYVQTSLNYVPEDGDEAYTLISNPKSAQVVVLEHTLAGSEIAFTGSGSEGKDFISKQLGE